MLGMLLLVVCIVIHGPWSVLDQVMDFTSIVKRNGKYYMFQHYESPRPGSEHDHILQYMNLQT
jgi:hypothetical protein